MAFSKANNESYWMLGKAYNDSGLLGLEYLGSHASDSGLTAVVEEDPFKDASLSPVDWTEFVLTTLDEMEGTLEEMEEYALYKFFGKIPDESNEAAVFGVRCQNEPGLYETIVIKSLDNVMSSADNKTD